MTVTVIGETLVDLVWRSDAAVVTPLAGGSPANLAVGLHRLGVPTTLLTCWGDDVPGALVAEYLGASGLPVVRARSASGRTALALAHIDAATGGADYDFLASWDPLDLPVPGETTLLATGSLAIAVEPGASRVHETCAAFRSRPAGMVAVDLNVRPRVLADRAAYRASAERSAAVADVVKASAEDLAWLYPGRSPSAAARDLLGLGPGLVVLTDGAEGAHVFMAGTETSVPSPPVRVVDTIGAGDAFQASLLAGLLHDGRPRLPADRETLERLIRRAVTAGALTCGRAGARPPGPAELEAAVAAGRERDRAGEGARHAGGPAA
ncbi:carbohydrate kinase [Streptosporangium sp. NPDC023615]|uniref:carbohydrate kinase family protein n=1 Tax=Streptosporangium sp. NPDC023615 TaxID=3154794 RepID=UPI0034450550